MITHWNMRKTNWNSPEYVKKCRTIFSYAFLSFWSNKMTVCWHQVFTTKCSENFLFSLRLYVRKKPYNKHYKTNRNALVLFLHNCFVYVLQGQLCRKMSGRTWKISSENNIVVIIKFFEQSKDQDTSASIVKSIIRGQLDSVVSKAEQEAKKQHIAVLDKTLKSW